VGVQQEKHKGAARRSYEGMYKHIQEDYQLIKT